MDTQDIPPLVIPAALIDLVMAAIRATQAWSSLPCPLPDLDPAMRELRETLGPLLKFQEDSLKKQETEKRSPRET